MLAYFNAAGIDFNNDGTRFLAGSGKLEKIIKRNEILDYNWSFKIPGSSVLSHNEYKISEVHL